MACHRLPNEGWIDCIGLLGWPLAGVSNPKNYLVGLLWFPLGPSKLRPTCADIPEIAAMRRRREIISNLAKAAGWRLGGGQNQ